MRFRFPRGVRVVVLLAVAALMAVPLAVAGSTTEIRGTDVASGLWFVELTGQPTAAGGSKSAAQAEKKAFRDAAKAAGVSYKERLAFDDLWNGLSVQAGSAQLEKISTLNGVKAVYPVELVSIPDTEPLTDPDLVTALAMTGADVAQSSLGFDGSGVKVAVMDTGLDLDHADLGGDGAAGAPHPNSRVVAQHDFVGDDFNADPSSPLFEPDTEPDPIADDCNGHGTHVSGIVGANGVVDGVAPGVTFGAYRVFGCNGSTTTDIMIAAMERALADDMDVLNMSIGSAFNTWPQYPTAAASDHLVNKGVVVVASIGNSGASGVYSAGAPGVGDNVIGVASFDNTHQNLATFTVSPDNAPIGYIGAVGSTTAPPLTGTFPLARTGTTSTLNDACNAVAPPAGSLTGKVVLIRRGTCGFYEKSINAQNAGAAGVILYNNAAGLLTPTVAGTPTVNIPVVFISQADGALIDGRIAAGPTTMTWTDDTISLVLATGGTISSFSSFGLGAELAVKPDIGAPGGFIRSTIPLELGTYGNNSGTSMSSPHVAGAVALLLESDPNIPTKRVRTVLQNSADPKVRFGGTDLDNVHRQGAGMLDIDDAIQATTWISPGKVSLGEGNGGTETLTLNNESGSAVTYDLSHQAALGTTNTFPPVSYSTAFSTVTFSSPSVTVPAGGSASVDVTITPNASLPNKAVYGGYVTFTPQGDGQEYRVPYAGFKGDYQSIQAMAPTPFGFPLLARLIACPFNGVGILRGSECFGGGNYGIPPASPPPVYTLVPGLNQTPMFLVHLDHQARRLTADVYRASDDKSMGEAFQLDYLGRSSGATSFFPFAWNGDVAKGNKLSPIADGTYYVKLTLIKALGNPSNAESWTSPDLTINRP